MPISILDYYVSVPHEKSVNFNYSFDHFVNSVHHKLYLFAIYSATLISDSLSKFCRYVLALIVRPLDFGYLAVEA